jgi:hypothetical protein
MLRLIRILQLTLRLDGLALIIVGAFIWGGHNELTQAHMGLGALFVLALWALSAVGFRSRSTIGLAVRGLIWGGVVLYFGMVQTQLLVGEAHVSIRILHLIVGLVAIGLGEALGARLRRAHRVPAP